MIGLRCFSWNLIFVVICRSLTFGGILRLSFEGLGDGEMMSVSLRATFKEAI